MMEEQEKRRDEIFSKAVKSPSQQTPKRRLVAKRKRSPVKPKRRVVE
jgi:hypothetical protein